MTKSRLVGGEIHPPRHLQALGAIGANYCSSPFHLYRLPSGRAYHVGKQDKLLWELEALEANLALSVQDLRKKLPLIQEHNAKLIDGGQVGIA
eukprot:7679626-Pyramimonas_sp.AAC.1